MSVDIKKEIDNLYLTSNCNYDFNNKRELLEKFGKQMWNAALDWAKENVKIKKTEELTSGTYDRGTSSSYSVYEDDGRYCTNFFIDKDSIEKGKINERSKNIF